MLVLRYQDGMGGKALPRKRRKQTMRNNIVKRLWACILCVVLIGGLTACGGGNTTKETQAQTQGGETNGTQEAEPQTLRVMWWGNQNRADLTSQMCDLFEEKHPGVTVEIEFTDFKGYWDKLSTLAISNQMPDVIQMDLGYLAQYSESGQLKALDSYMTDGAIDVSGVNATSLNSGKYKDVTYAIPTGSNATTLAYRLDVVKAAGVEIPMEMTWSEFIAIAKTVYEKTGRTQTLTNGDYFELSLRNAGLSYFNDDNTALGFDDPAYIVDTWQRSLTAIEEGYGLAPSKASATGKTDVLIQDTWVTNVWTNQLATYESDSGCELGVAQIVAEDDAVAPSNWLKPAMFWSIPSEAKNADLAAEFINFFINETAVYDIVGVDRGIPIDKDVQAYIEAKLEGVAAKNNAFISWLSTEGEVGDIIVDLNAEAVQVRDLLAETTQGVMLGVITDLEAAAKDFMQKANNILAGAAK